MKDAARTSLSTLFWVLALVVFAFLCYSFVIWNGCDSSPSSFVSDFRAFHGEGC